MSLTTINTVKKLTMSRFRLKRVVFRWRLQQYNEQTLCEILFELFVWSVLIHAAVVIIGQILLMLGTKRLLE